MRSRRSWLSRPLLLLYSIGALACAKGPRPTAQVAPAPAGLVGCLDLTFSPDSDSRGPVPPFPTAVRLTSVPVTNGPAFGDDRPAYELGPPLDRLSSLPPRSLSSYWWQLVNDTLFIVNSDGFNWRTVSLLPDADSLNGRLAVGGDVGPPFEHDHWRARARSVPCRSAV
jgi:hypothetical protein